MAHGVAEARSLFDGEILRHALGDAVKKFDPRAQIKNPVMFVVLVGSVITLVEAIAHPGIFSWSITIWLFLTVIFANFAEAMAEGRGKAQADTLQTHALGDRGSPTRARRHRGAGAGVDPVKGDLVVCEAGRRHPLRRRDHRGGGVGGRVGHHRRVRACHPGVRWGPLGGDRWHQGALGPHRGAHHGGARARPSSTG